MTKAEIAASKLAAWQASLKNQAARFYALENNKRNKTAQELQSVVSQLNHQLKNKCNHARQRVHIIHLMTKISFLKQEIECCTDVIWSLMDNEEIMEADILLDSLVDEAINSFVDAREYLEEIFPHTASLPNMGRLTSEHRAIIDVKFEASQLSLSGCNPELDKQFWMSFDDKIAKKNISNKDKFEILKACCIAEAASFADSDVWRNDHSNDAFFQLAGALKLHFKPEPQNEQVIEAPASEKPVSHHSAPHSCTSPIQYGQEKSFMITFEEVSFIEQCSAITDEAKVTNLDEALFECQKTATVVLTEKSLQINEISTPVENNLKINTDETAPAGQKIIPWSKQEKTIKQVRQETSLFGQAQDRTINQVRQETPPFGQAQAQEMEKQAQSFGPISLKLFSVTKQDFHSTKNIKDPSFARKNLEFQLPLRALVPVRIQELLTWIAKTKYCSFAIQFGKICAHHYSIIFFSVAKEGCSKIKIWMKIKSMLL